MKTILVLFLVYLSGCAGIATKGDISPVSRFPKVDSGKTLIYRAAYVTPLPGGGVERRPHASDADLGKIIQDTGLFSKVTSSQSPANDVTFFGKETAADQKRLLAVPFPIEADYFLDLEYTGKYLGPHGYNYWALVHMMSLGLIPIAINNDIHLNAKLYDRNGKLLQEKKIDDTSTIWGWLPLFLVNGFKLFVKETDLTYPIQKNTLEQGLVEVFPSTP